MPSNLRAIKSQYKTLPMMLEEAKELYPDLRNAIVITFSGENGDMGIHYYCSSAAMAMAGARLLHLAGRDDE